MDCVECLAKELDRLVSDCIVRLRTLSEKYRLNRRYRVASRLSGLAASLSDAWHPLHYCVHNPCTPEKILRYYGGFYNSLANILYEDAIDIDYTSKFFEDAVKLATQLVLGLLCIGFNGVDDYVKVME